MYKYFINVNRKLACGDSSDLRKKHRKGNSILLNIFSYIIILKGTHACTPI